MTTVTHSEYTRFFMKIRAMAKDVRHAEIEREMRENAEGYDSGNLINGEPEYMTETLSESEWLFDAEEGC